MNKIFKLFGGTLMVTVAAFTACSPEKFDAPDQNGIPSISGVDIQLTVDQTVNQATYTVAGLQKATYPIWLLDGKTYSTLTQGAYSNSKAGTHTLELRIGNKNGFSQGTVFKEFTFDNTIIDFTPYINRITGEWRINYAEAGHMGCGEPGTDGSNWWSAAPNDKADWGVYDDRITFTADRQYTYNPGEGGTVYVNKDVNAFSSFNTNDGNDYMAEVSEQNSTYSFDADGDKILLRLPAQTLFPYISSDAQYNDPVFTVSKLTDTDMTLLYEGDGITWRFMLTTKDPSDGPDEPEAVMDWDYASSSNLWKAVDDGTAFDAFGYYFADDGWSPISYSEVTKTGNAYELTLPEGLGGSQWQGQFHIDTKLTASADKAYNFQFDIESDYDLPGVTMKLTDSGDTNWFTEERHDVASGDVRRFTWKGVKPHEGADASAIRLFFDFGGSPAGAKVKISNIVFKEAQ